MFSKFPREIQLKIQNYVYELEISKKKEYFKQVHHELLYGWWYTELSKNTYHVSTQYCDKPTIINHLSLDEIYTLYCSQHIEWKPFLYYTLSFGKAHFLAGGMLFLSFIILLTLYYSNKQGAVRVK